MSGDWRAWALTAGALLLAGGTALWVATGNPTLFVIGALAIVTSIVERTYGAPTAARPNAGLRPTDERFVDPESGLLVTVWFDPKTGERRYVADGETQRQS